MNSEEINDLYRRAGEQQAKYRTLIFDLEDAYPEGCGKEPDAEVIEQYREWVQAYNALETRCDILMALQFRHRRPPLAQ